MAALEEVAEEAEVVVEVVEVAKVTVADKVEIEMDTAEIEEEVAEDTIVAVASKLLFLQKEDQFKLLIFSLQLIIRKS